jgi:hypothetical protein
MKQTAARSGRKQSIRRRGTGVHPVQTGLFRCSMYRRRTLTEAPPMLLAKREPDHNLPTR